MEKEEVKSKWDELAREIGAEVTSETEKIVEAVSTQPDASASYSPAASKKQERAPTKRPAAGWDNLADEFGLPVPEPVEPPVEETVVATTKQVVVPRTPESDPPRREQHEERPPRERQPRERRPRGSQRSERHSRDQGESERRPSRGGSRGRGPSDRDRESREDRPRRGRRHGSERHERRPNREHRDVEAEQVEDAESLEMSEIRDEIGAEARELEREVPQEQPKPSPAVSLWQKIFGTPTDTPKPADPVARETDARELGDFESTSQYETSRRHDEEGRSASRRDADVSETDDRSSADLGDEPDSVDREESTERRERRPRRRRRGRGGRGDTRDEARSADSPRRAPAREDFDEGADELDDAAAEDSDVEDEDAEDEDVASGNGADNVEHAGSRRSRSALQRSIPSWDEAIGHIVDLNMQARSQRRPSSQSGPQRGRPRGRRSR